VIRLEGIDVRLGQFALRDVSFEIPAAGYGLLIGPTGSGKTSVLQAIAGHARVGSGRVLLHGKDVTAVPPEHRGVGVVYQQNNLFPHLSVAENIRYGIAHGDLSRPDQKVRVGELADGLGLRHLLERGVANLSGGEAQRVGLARALASRPSVLLLDEPFASLDPATRFTLRQQLLELHRREGVTTLQVTHEFQEALQLGNLVAVMSEGRIVQHGKPEEVFRHPNSSFVARFIGAANVLEGVVTRVGDAEDADRQFAARFTTGAVTLDVIAGREGSLNAVIHPEDIALSHRPTGGSARNQLPATVTALELTGPVTYVHLDAGCPLRAAVTSTSAEAMGLAAGVPLIATIKATAIRLV
jgi:molybdopterin-binding protein